MPYRRPRLTATISSPYFDMPYAFCGLDTRSGVACISSGPPQTGHGMSQWPAASALSGRMPGVCSPSTGHRYSPSPIAACEDATTTRARSSRSATAIS